MKGAGLSPGDMLRWPESVTCVLSALTLLSFWTEHLRILRCGTSIRVGRSLVSVGADTNLGIV